MITYADCVDNYTHNDVYIVKTYSSLIVTLAILVSVLATSLAIHHSNVEGVQLRGVASLGPIWSMNGDNRLLVTYEPVEFNK